VERAEAALARELRTDRDEVYGKARRGAGLDRTITQFYAVENEFKKKIEEKRTRAEAEENKLIQQIQEAKLFKFAQSIFRSVNWSLKNVSIVGCISPGGHHLIPKIVTSQNSQHLS
jgi:hypothetical protein